MEVTPDSIYVKPTPLLTLDYLLNEQTHFSKPFPCP